MVWIQITAANTRNVPVGESISRLDLGLCQEMENFI